MKTPIIIAIVLILAAGGFIFYDTLMKQGETPDTTQNEATTTPQQMPTVTYVNASADTITVSNPSAGAHLGSSFTVSGQARGTWYFEASFPIEVLDRNGNQLLQKPVQATGDWMTENFVPFTINLTVPNYSGPATIVLHKDNPSGKPEFEASLSIPVMIASTTAQ